MQFNGLKLYTFIHHHRYLLNKSICPPHQELWRVLYFTLLMSWQVSLRQFRRCWQKTWGYWVREKKPLLLMVQQVASTSFMLASVSLVSWAPQEAMWRQTYVDARYTVDLCQFLSLGNPNLFKANQAKFCPRRRHYIYYTCQHTNLSSTPKEDSISMCTVQMSLKS